MMLDVAVQRRLLALARSVRFVKENFGLWFFADEQIPMNVGIGHANLDSLLQPGFGENSVVRL